MGLSIDFLSSSWCGNWPSPKYWSKRRCGRSHTLSYGLSLGHMPSKVKSYFIGHIDQFWYRLVLQYLSGQLWYSGRWNTWGHKDQEKQPWVPSWRMPTTDCFLGHSINILPHKNTLSPLSTPNASSIMISVQNLGLHHINQEQE